MKLISGLFLLLADIIFIVMFFAISVLGTMKQPALIALFFLLFGIFNLFYMFRSKFWIRTYSPANTALLVSINTIFTVVYSLLLIKIITSSGFREKFGMNSEDYYMLIIAILIPIMNLVYNSVLKLVKKSNVH